MEMQTRFVTEMLKFDFLGFRQFKASFSNTNNNLLVYKNLLVSSLNSNVIIEELKKQVLNHAGLSRSTKE